MSLAKTIIYGTVNDVKPLLQQGADVNEIDEFGFTPLIEAAIVNKMDIAELLINHGADVNQPDVTKHYALHWTVDNHHLPFCKLLLDHGADANAYNRSGQPPLVLPLLRQQTDLKKLLYHYGANLDFAQDYINTKLLGHRFELDGQVHIINHQGDFILVDFEGFLFEFTSSIVQNSLERYKSNYAAKRLQSYFNKLDSVIAALANASELIKLQQYSIDLRLHERRIRSLTANEPLIIPIAYQGHAITCVKFGDLFVKCDRGAFSKIIGSSIVVYKINNPQGLTQSYMHDLLYKVINEGEVQYGIDQTLGLTRILDIPISSQIAGNCSWANVEATIPTVMFLLMAQELQTKNRDTIEHCIQTCIGFFNQWHDWDKERALDDCIQSFSYVEPKRKASKAAILATILVHRLKYTEPKDVKLAEKILPVLYHPEYDYILNSYIKVYRKDPEDPIGKNLFHLLDMAAPIGKR